MQTDDFDDDVVWNWTPAAPAGHPPASAPTPAAASAEDDDIDALLADLDAAMAEHAMLAKPTPAPQPQPARRTRVETVNTLPDLRRLLAELGPHRLVEYDHDHVDPLGPFNPCMPLLNVVATEHAARCTGSIAMNSLLNAVLQALDSGACPAFPPDATAGFALAAAAHRMLTAAMCGTSVPTLGEALRPHYRLGVDTRSVFALWLAQMYAVEVQVHGADALRPRDRCRAPAIALATIDATPNWHEYRPMLAWLVSYVHDVYATKAQADLRKALQDARYKEGAQVPKHLQRVLYALDVGDPSHDLRDAAGALLNPSLAWPEDAASNSKQLFR